MTRFLVTGRRTGKTTAAVQWVNEAPGRVLVTIDEAEAVRVRREFFPDPDNWDDGPRSEKVVALHQVLAGRLRGRGIFELGVDNLDHMLYQIFHHQVGLVTATGDSATSPGRVKSIIRAVWRRVTWG